ncbi:MAG: sugar transferase [Candidatus Omnitrophica bacterium]|nr:sugar transferase [Candidatus Omnitrophota bacterium]
MKRVFDIIVSVIGIFLSFTLWIFITAIIKLEYDNPIFYFQERVGKNNKIFKVIKFRTMIKDAEKHAGAVWAKEDDPRVTRIGRVLRATAMDELPQLLNILKGDMSFVGPRPERPELVIKFIKEFPEFNHRHVVVPGLTGVAQVLGSAYLDYRDKFKYDMWYIKNHKFSLDLYLMILSFLVTFMGEWEFSQNKISIISGAFRRKVNNEILILYARDK